MAISEFARDVYLRESTFNKLKVSTIGKKAKADGLSFKDTANTLWWEIVFDGDVIGVGGMIKANPTSWRPKSTFILPEWRRHGFYTVSIWLRMIKAYELGGTWIEGIARPTSGAALKRIGWKHEEGRHRNFLHMNIKELFDEQDLTRNPVDLLIELCPEVI